MDTNIKKEPIASIFEVEFHATQGQQVDQGKRVRTWAAGKPIRGCILLSASDYLTAKVFRHP